MKKNLYHVKNVTMSFNCINCDILEKNEQGLLKHQKSKLCLKYKNITFTCNLCHFQTKGIKNIRNHIDKLCKKQVIIDSIK